MAKLRSRSFDYKLVVVVTGEHGFNNDQGNCSGITYDGVGLVQAIDRNPLASGTSALMVTQDWLAEVPLVGSRTLRAPLPEPPTAALLPSGLQVQRLWKQAALRST